MPELGVDVAEIARLARHFNVRATGIIYGAGSMPSSLPVPMSRTGYAFSRALSHAVYNRISTFGHYRFGREWDVSGLFTLSIELRCVYAH
jgi:hypothetical protein